MHTTATTFHYDYCLHFLISILFVHCANNDNSASDDDDDDDTTMTDVEKILEI